MSQVRFQTKELTNLKGEPIHKLKLNQLGKIWMTPKYPLVVETLTENPMLGRFVLRDMGVSVGIGLVEKIERGRYA